MHRLIPDLFVEQFSAGEMSGEFRAAALFVDISGFSTFTNDLMAHGQHGAEVLATIMRAVFEPLLHSVYEQGGFVVTLAGDAFTALFTLDRPAEQGHQRALATAWAIQERMAAVAEQATPSGTFSLAVKVGVADGDVDWGIVLSQDGARAAYYFRGPAIDGSLPPNTVLMRVMLSWRQISTPQCAG